MDWQHPAVAQKQQQKRADEQKHIDDINEYNMIVKQMAERPGRDFVRMVLSELKYDKPFTINTADAYRHLAKQEAAIKIKEIIYKHCPDMWELMMREEAQK